MSRCIRAVSAAIVAVGTDNGWEQFPTTPEDKAATKREFLRRGGTDGVVGCVDGTLVAITKPKDLNPGETQGFWARKGYYALNVMIVCDASLRIMAVEPNFPGSCHDAFVWRQAAFCRRLTSRHHNEPGEFLLLGDSAYPLQPWLMTPVAGHPDPRGKVQCCTWHSEVCH